MANSNTPAVQADTLTSELVLNLIETGEYRNKKFVTTVADPVETARRIALRDLSASSLDELLGGSETISGRDYIGKPFTLLSVEWQVSEIEGDGLPFYAVLHIADINGNAKTLTTGAVTVVRKLAVISARGWLPAPLKIVKLPKTEAGYEPLDLVKAPEIEQF